MRYHLFVHADYYPHGGWYDWKGTFWTLKRATLACYGAADEIARETPSSGCSFHIVKRGKIVDTGDLGDFCNRIIKNRNTLRKLRRDLCSTCRGGGKLLRKIGHVCVDCDVPVCQHRRELHWKVCPKLPKAKGRETS